MRSSIGIVGPNATESLISQFTRSILARLGLDPDYGGINALSWPWLSEMRNRPKCEGRTRTQFKVNNVAILAFY